MLRLPILPPSKFDIEPTDAECITMAFHVARHAPYEDDKKQAMHAAVSWLTRGLLWIDDRFEEYK
jgi:hypothetical protein